MLAWKYCLPPQNINWLCLGGSGLPRSCHDVGGLVQVLVSCQLLWALWCVHRSFLRGLWHVVWVWRFWPGPGDDRSQAQTAVNVVTVCVVVFWGRASGVGRVGAFWVCSGSPNIVSASRRPGGHQALLPCDGSQVTGVLTAANLWLPSLGGAYLLPVFYIPIPLSPLAPIYSTNSHT